MSGERYPTSEVSLAVDYDVTLQAVILADAEKTYRLVRDSAEFLEKSLEWAADYTYDKAQIEFSTAVSEAKQGLMAPYKILYRGNFVGMTRLHSRLGTTAQMGYWIDPNQQGKRIAIRAAEGLRDYGFYQWGLDEINLHIKPDNQPSLRVAKSLGAAMVGYSENDLSGKMNTYEIWNLRKDAY